jgi:hypothetical protein
LIQTDDELDPTWVSAHGPAGMPALAFNDVDANRMTIESSSAALLGALSGTNRPFSILATIQASSASEAYGIARLSGANALIRLEVNASNKLLITRQDDGSTFANLTGTIELGTSARRVGVTFDGGALTLYQDAQRDNVTEAAGGQGALTLTAGRVGNYAGGTSGPTLYLKDLAIVPRAVNRNEWLHYYEWSVQQWGAIQAPQFAGAGTGVHGVGAGTITPSYPSSPSAGALLVLVTSQAIESSPTTVPGDWTLQGEQVGSTFTLRFYAKRAAGGESGTINVGVNSAGSAVQMFAFNQVSRTPNFSGGSMESLAGLLGGGTSIGGPTIGPNGYGRLAVNFIIGLGTNVGANSGSSGGTWAEASEYDAANSLFIQLQTAQLGVAPISGGTTSWTTAGGSESFSFGFALVGE